MDSENGGMMKWALILVVVVAIMAAIKFPNQRNKIIAIVTHASPTPEETATPAPTASPIPRPPSQAPPNTLIGAQYVVKDYMAKHATAQCTFDYLNWTDFSVNGQSSYVTVHYKVHQPAKPDVEATVKFTLEGPEVAHTQLVPTMTPPPPPSAVALLSRQPVPTTVLNMQLDEYANAQPPPGTIVKLTFDRRDADMTDANGGGKLGALLSVRLVGKVTVYVPPGGVEWFDSVPTELKAGLAFGGAVKDKTRNVYGKVMEDSSQRIYLELIGTTIRDDAIDGKVGSFQ